MYIINLTGQLIRESVDRSEITVSLEIQRPYDHSVTITIVPKDDEEDSAMFDAVSPFFNTQVTIKCTVGKDGYLTANSNDITEPEEFIPRNDDRALPGLLRSDAFMINSLRGQIHDKYQADIDDWIADMERAATVLDTFDKVLWENGMNIFHKGQG